MCTVSGISRARRGGLLILGVLVAMVATLAGEHGYWATRASADGSRTINLCKSVAGNGDGVVDGGVFKFEIRTAEGLVREEQREAYEPNPDDNNGNVGTADCSTEEVPAGVEVMVLELDARPAAWNGDAQDYPQASPPGTGQGKQITYGTGDLNGIFYNKTNSRALSLTGKLIIKKVGPTITGDLATTPFGGTYSGPESNGTWSAYVNNSTLPVDVKNGAYTVKETGMPKTVTGGKIQRVGYKAVTDPADCSGDPAGYSDSTEGAQVTVNGDTQVVCVLNTFVPDVPARVLMVCKHVESDSAMGGVFTIEVGDSTWVTGNLAPGNESCQTYDVADGAVITIEEIDFPPGWNGTPGYPQVMATGFDPTNSTSIEVTIGEGSCGAPEGDLTRTETLASDETVEMLPDCVVDFYNRSSSTTGSSPTPTPTPTNTPTPPLSLDFPELPSPTPEPPTATPVPPTVAPPTPTVVATAGPTLVEPTQAPVVAGARTPAPTPIAPRTGAGAEASGTGIDLILVVAALAIAGGTMTIAATFRRHRT